MDSADSMRDSASGRRAFLQKTAMVAAAVSVGGLLSEAVSAPMEHKGSPLFVCQVCGHVEFGRAPESCPVCHSPKDKFLQDDMLFMNNEMKFKDLSAKHKPELTVKSSTLAVMGAPAREVFAAVGKTLHPMDDNHYITWIDYYIGDRFVSRLLQTPKAVPAVCLFGGAGSGVRVIAHCNLHGHWQSEAKL